MEVSFQALQKRRQRLIRADWLAGMKEWDAAPDVRERLCSLAEGHAITLITTAEDGVAFFSADGLRKCIVTVNEFIHGAKLIPIRGELDTGPTAQGLAELDKRWWIHASITKGARHPSGEVYGVMPDYADLKWLHEMVFGPERISYQLFVPVAEHCNTHEQCLHLWGPANMADRPTPNFNPTGLGV